MSDRTNDADSRQTPPAQQASPDPQLSPLPPPPPSTATPPPLAQRTDEVNALKEQVAQLTELVRSLAVQQQQPAMPPQGQFPPPPPQDMSVGFNDAQYYVRVKPYDPKRGQVRRRQFFHEIGRALNGGTGKPGDIPEWYLVDRQTAIELSKYRQNDADPMSLPVLDIVTLAEREQVEHAEMQFRQASLGLLGMDPQAMRNAAAEAGQVRSRVINQGGVNPVPQQAVRHQPAILGDAQVYMQQMGQPQGYPQPQPQLPQQPSLPQQPQLAGVQPIQGQGQPQPQPQQPLPADVAGRAAALSDLDAPADQAAPQVPPPAPPSMSRPGVVEDLTTLAARDPGAKEAVEAAAKYDQ